MDDLRVLAFCDYFRPDVGGGAERVAREVYGRMVRSGAEVSVVTTTGSAAPWRGLEPGLQVVEIPSMDLTRVLRFQRSLSFGGVRSVVPTLQGLRPHVLHANSLEFETSRTAARLRALGRTPLVLTAHIAGFGEMPEPWKLLGALHDRTVGARLLRRADRVIAVSRAVSRHLASLRTPSAKVRVVPNGVDHDVFRPPVEREGTRDPRILFVGRLVPNKGADLAIDAIDTLLRDGRRAHLRIVGEGPLRGRLEARVRQLGLGASVTFTGASSDVAGLLRGADVFVRPTTTEGMSLAVLEAMASGVCVVASDVPGNAELIRDGENGLLAPARDVDGLAASLRRAVDDPAGRRRLADAAFEDSQAYSWDRCAKETMDVLLETARRTTPSR